VPHNPTTFQNNSTVDTFRPMGRHRPIPAAPAISTVHIVLDTNVLLGRLVMVIQKFVEDIERMGWPSSVVVPNVVISELDWWVLFYVLSISA
jgi:hypothetical protein